MDTPAPGVVPETPATPDPQGYNTTVDNQMEQPIQEKDEAMAEQNEIDFPSSTERKVPSPQPGSQSRPQTRGRNGAPKKDIDFEARQFDSLDPKDYGIDFQDETPVYEPPERDDTLPDLYRLMATLEEEGGETSEGSPITKHTVITKRQAPSLFAKPENVSSYKKITELKMEIEDHDLPDYMQQYMDGVREDVLMIGSIGLDDVQEEEKRLRDEHINYMHSMELEKQKRMNKVLTHEEEAKRRTAQDLRAKRLQIQQREQLGQQKEKLVMDRLQKSFRRAENQLIRGLEARKGEVRTYYGDLMTADGHYGGTHGRRWKVDWDKTPQPIQVKMGCLRGVKDKLPGGRFVVIVSLYNRLGGHVMRWSNLKGQQWGGATLPVNHDGHFYNVEMKVEQSVFTVLPAKSGVRPGMVLMFEIFLLRGAVVATDRVVGWGCFPVADGQFDIVEGKFKCPMLRGEMDHRIDKHEKLEELMASDLDHWLCNLYFEIVKLPRYLAGQKEYEVELQFSSSILAYPDRVNIGEEYRDGEAPIPGSDPDLKSLTTNSDHMIRSHDLDLTLSQTISSDHYVESKKPLPDDDDIIKKRPGSGDTVKDLNVDLRMRRPATMYGSRTAKKEQRVKMPDEDDDTDYDEEDVYLTKKDPGFFPVKGQPGMYYKRHEFNPVDEYHKKMYSLLPRTPILNAQRRKRRKLTHLEQLEEHSFAVGQHMDDKGHIPREGVRKMQYVRRQLLAELGLSQWRSREFWGMLLMFIIVFFIRIYIHYIGQWLLLQGLELPVNKLTFYPYTVNLNYQATMLRTREEIAIVLLGPFSNILLFVLLVCFSWLIQKILFAFPDIGSKFIMAVGLQAFLDPFLILIVDCCLQRYLDLGGDNPIGDFAKLYWHFLRAEGSGMAGVFITIFLYFFSCFCAGAIVYMYFLRLHNNGRMLDIYWRLHGTEEVFFMPYDLEVSNQELSYLVTKSDQWRGEEGERRKITVYDYVWEEEEVEETVWDESGSEVTRKLDPNKEITTHVSVHTLHLDGLRELYRHFLRLPDGGVIEVFGDMSVAGMDKDVKVAVTEGMQTLENLGMSTLTLNELERGGTALTSSGFDIDDDDKKKSKLV